MLKHGLAALFISLSFIPSAFSDELRRIAGSELDGLLERARQSQILIKGGSFLMGDFGAVESGQWRPYFPPTAEINKAHTVHLSDFSLSAHETIWQDFDTYTLLQGKPAVIWGGQKDYPREPYVQDTDDYYHIRKPARVSWQDAKDYCLWLGHKTGLAFDLPTSAQWEFSARNRGSKEWIYPTHDGKPAPDSDERTGVGCDFWTGICQVGTDLPPNPLGLFDLGGNADEWVNDWYSDTYYQESDGVTDPQGPRQGIDKEVRSLGYGSIHFSFSRTGLSAARADGSPGLAGFRCAVQSPEPLSSLLETGLDPSHD